MKFSRSKNYDFPAELTIGGSDILEVKKEHVILGIIVQDDLKWPSQCEEMVKRATVTMWALRRAPRHAGRVLEGVGQGQAGVWLPSLALQPDVCPVPLTGQSPASCHGCHYWQVGAFTHPAAGGFRAQETFGQKDKDLQDLCPANCH